MESTARSKYLRLSARKVRRVAALVRGKMVTDAVDLLRFVPKRASESLSKTIRSAAANVIASEGSARVKAEDLRVTSIVIDGGPILKRFQAASMGRAYKIRKRTCHLTIKVSDEGRTKIRLEKEKVKSSSRKKSTKSPISEDTE